jgi:hypothetical protein
MRQALTCPLTRRPALHAPPAALVCPSNCSTCAISGGSTACTACSTGYGLSNGACGELARTAGRAPTLKAGRGAGPEARCAGAAPAPHHTTLLPPRPPRFACSGLPHRLQRLQWRHLLGLLHRLRAVWDLVRCARARARRHKPLPDGSGCGADSSRARPSRAQTDGPRCLPRLQSRCVSLAAPPAPSSAA